jgi:hypothetical protein
MLRATLHFRALMPTDIESEMAGAKAEPSSGDVRSYLRSLIPARIREAVSRRIARKGRTKDLTEDHLSADWPIEWIARLNALDSSSVIWEPLIMPRGHGDQDSETIKLTSTVNNLISRLTAGGEDGLGVLALRNS